MHKIRNTIAKLDEPRMSNSNARTKPRSEFLFRVLQVSKRKAKLPAHENCCSAQLFGAPTALSKARTLSVVRVLRKLPASELLLRFLSFCFRVLEPEPEPAHVRQLNQPLLSTLPLPSALFLEPFVGEIEGERVSESARAGERRGVRAGVEEAIVRSASQLLSSPSLPPLPPLPPPEGLAELAGSAARGTGSTICTLLCGLNLVFFGELSI